ncbi:hypothetical protein SAMN05421806_1016 [Streptomyces indicus]|uniref:Uncharacterized protein n=1 Tax=Streptomyces indicus TaxID=417292 RepID=A0A1G8T1Q8_9ACTN|nr:hypothetical protein SAMN05421806_1016 [Streptomyces indicus]
MHPRRNHAQVTRVHPAASHIAMGLFGGLGACMGAER